MKRMKLFSLVRLSFVGFLIVLLGPSGLFALNGTPSCYYEALLDTDNTLATGGAVTVVQGSESPHEVTGIELRAVVSFSRDSGELGPILLYRYNGGSGLFELVHTNPVFYDMGFGNGADGCDVVELEAPREILGFLPETVRTVFHASTDLFNDYTEAFPCPVERAAIPALGGPGAVILGLLILAAALWVIRRKRNLPGSLLLLFLIAVLAVRLAWAASIVLDGQVSDWAGLSPAVTDPSGDSSSGNPYEDICRGYATSDTGKLYFRMDVTGKKGEISSISLEKSTNGVDADLPPGPTIPVGDPVLWTYVTTNTGNVNLTGVTVTDDQGIAVTCPKTSLQPGESMTCTGSGIATAGQYANLGTASGNPPSGPAVTVSDPSHYFGNVPPGAPGIDLEKSTNGVDADLPPGPTIPVGDPVLWTYVTTNTGNVNLTGVTVTDDQGVAVSCPKTTLQPGESMTCTGRGTATAGQYANLGTASGKPPSGPTVTVSDPGHYFGTYQGCTPAYWKNHTGSWPPTGYSPIDAVATVFPNAASWPVIASSTLLQALDFAEGSGVEGAAEILLRAGVAALLNASHPGISYPRTAAEVLASVDGALGTGDGDVMLLLAASLDADNNRGCPLS